MLHAEDKRRPFVWQEKERFKSALQKAGVKVHEQQYFNMQSVTLLMHFEAIEAMQRAVNVAVLPEKYLHQ